MSNPHLEIHIFHEVMKSFSEARAKSKPYEKFIRAVRDLYNYIYNI